MDIALHPRGETRDVDRAEVEVRETLICGPREARRDAVDFLRDQRGCAILDARPFGLDFVAEAVGATLFHQDLDARLVDVVASAEAVVYTQDRFEVREQVRPRQELADDDADQGRAAKSAADEHLEAELAGFVPHGLQADVVHGERYAVLLGPVQGDLELAW